MIGNDFQKFKRTNLGQFLSSGNFHHFRQQNRIGLQWDFGEMMFFMIGIQ